MCWVSSMLQVDTELYSNKFRVYGPYTVTQLMVRCKDKFNMQIFLLSSTGHRK